MKGRIGSVEDLDVYRRLCDLHLEIHFLTLEFPKFEMFELGSQLRRSSNSIAANLAEGWNSKHTKIYLTGINRSLGELRETRHHLSMAYRKRYFGEDRYLDLLGRYEECGRMLRGLERSLERFV
ncbi:MAG: four helix bundle protein [Bacteroidota bacterium]